MKWIYVPVRYAFPFGQSTLTSSDILMADGADEKRLFVHCPVTENCPVI